MVEAILALFGALFTSVFSYDVSRQNRDTQYNTNKETMEFQSEEAEKGREFQERMYDKEYQNELPVTRYKNLKALGINDNAIYQSILGVSPSASVPSASTASASLPPLPGLDFGMSNIVGEILNQASKTRAEVANLDANTNKTNVEINWIPKVNAANIDKIRADISNNAGMLHLKAAELELAKQLASSTLSLNEFEMEKKRAEINKMASDIYVNYQQYLQSQRESNARIENIQSSTAVNEANVEYVNANTDNVQADTFNKDLQSEGFLSDANMKAARATLYSDLGVDMESSIGKQIWQATLNGTLGKIVDATYNTASSVMQAQAMDEFRSYLRDYFKSKGNYDAMRAVDEVSDANLSRVYRREWQRFSN